MRIKWRGLELPSRITADPRFKSDTYGRFIVEPFERGFGTTIGNALRRVLLSSLEGASVTNVKIKGASHEFSTLPGVLEDVTDIILNVKSLVVMAEAELPPEGKTLRVAVQGPGEVVADMLEGDAAIKVLNKDLVLATLTDKVQFELEMNVKRGRGYVPAAEAASTAEDQEIGVINVDASYSPVQRVRFAVEETRVGQKTNYDKLVMEIWTNGTVVPHMALVEAAKILRKHLNVFLQNAEIGEATASVGAVAVPDPANEELFRKLNRNLSDLDLSVRASNCLESARILYVHQLVTKTDADLLKVRAFGRTSLREVKRKLEDMSLTLGMTLPAGFQPVTA
ncbi:MAG: DNA-directed RNA polymerase subunit alpha [Planctomycetaceae bacterium]|jgi:DNA-directed RNA polymerase subunit alpha|nr:DNA-directed RNA polymerase subunit alpha [Phycisphaerales bacterium]MCE2652301.1 DNA-directed RNA polymerase subunit alpha [Planctomycetaceae bacterium]